MKAGREKHLYIIPLRGTNNPNGKKMLYRFYIGSNNATGELETVKAIKLISKYFQGFTAYNALGYWEGKPENSLIVEVADKEERREMMQLLAKKLCQELQQQAVGLAEVGNMEFISL